MSRRYDRYNDNYQIPVGIGSEGIAKEANVLAEVLRRQQDEEEFRKRRNILMLLGAKFSGDVSKASSIDELTSVMFKANQQAYMTGVPELAGQINNLAQIKGMELKYNKEELNQAKVAEMYRNTLGSMPTIEGENLVDFSQTEEFKKIATMPADLQPTALQLAYQKKGAKINEGVLYNDKGGIDYIKYAADSQGQTKLIKQLTAGADGTYDNKLTTDITEHEKEPLQVTMAKSEAEAKRRELEMTLQKQFKYYAATQDQKPFLANLSDGSVALIDFVHDPKTGRTYAVNLMGEDPKADVSGKIVGKMGTAGIPNQFKTLNDYEKAMGQLEGNLDRAAGEVKTGLQNLLPSMPDEELAGLVQRYDFGKERASAFTNTNKDKIENYINKNYQKYQNDDSPEGELKRGQLAKLKSYLSTFKSAQEEIQTTQMLKPVIKGGVNKEEIYKDPFHQNNDIYKTGLPENTFQ